VAVVDVTAAVEAVAPASHTPSLLKRAFGVAADEAVAAVVIAVAAVVSAKQQWNHGDGGNGDGGRSVSLVVERRDGGGARS
jgi:hypothetical protein